MRMLIDQHDKILCYVKDETSTEDIHTYIEDLVADRVIELNEAHSCKVGAITSTQFHIYGDEDFIILDLITIQPLF